MSAPWLRVRNEAYECSPPRRDNILTVGMCGFTSTRTQLARYTGEDGVTVLCNRRTRRHRHHHRQGGHRQQRQQQQRHDATTMTGTMTSRRLRNTTAQRAHSSSSSDSRSSDSRSDSSERAEVLYHATCAVAPRLLHNVMPAPEVHEVVHCAACHSRSSSSSSNDSDNNSGSVGGRGGAMVAAQQQQQLQRPRRRARHGSTSMWQCCRYSCNPVHWLFMAKELAMGRTFHVTPRCYAYSSLRATNLGGLRDQRAFTRDVRRAVRLLRAEEAAAMAARRQQQRHGQQEQQSTALLPARAADTSATGVDDKSSTTTAVADDDDYCCCCADDGSDADYVPLGDRAATTTVAGDATTTTTTASSHEANASNDGYCNTCHRRRRRVSASCVACCRPRRLCRHLVLFGVSRGATTCFYSAMKLPKELAAYVSLVLLEAPFDTLQHVTDASCWWPRLARCLFRLVGDYRDADDERDAYDYDTARVQLRCPLAFVMTRNDRRVPNACTEALIRRVRTTLVPHVVPVVEVLVLEHSAHPNMTVAHKDDQDAPVMHEAVDALRVAYTGALHVPLCLGSVAVPLHNSHYNDYNNNNKDDGSRSRSATASAAATSSHRCTHKRYCYVRDGASLDEDAFYRWLYAHTYTDATQSTATTTTTAAATTTPSAVNTSHSRTRKRTRSTAASHTRRAAHGDVHDDGKKRSDAHDDDATADNDNDANDESDNDDEEDETTQPATERDVALPVRSPSLLYALIDHVVFVLPRSFAQPRRVLYAPPFVIEDDTWAPHMVEVTLYFAAALAVAPVTLSHHVLLQPHCEIAPQLRAMTYGQAKPPTLVLLPPPPASTTTTTTPPPSSHMKDNDGHAAVADAQDAAVHASARGSNKDSSDARTVAAAAAVTQLVVSERKDSLRVVHPSVPLLRFVARVLRVARGVTVSQLRRFFVEHVACAATNTTSATARQSTRDDDGDGDAVVMRWRLPYEEHIAAHAHERAARAQRALQTTAAALHDEQACLWRSCDTAVRDTAALVQQLNDALDAMHTACVQLADRPSLAP